MGLVNQTTVSLSNDSRKLMEDLKETLKSIRQWAWSQANEDTFINPKKHSKGLRYLLTGLPSFLS